MEARGSRTRLRYLMRPVAVFIKMVSPSSSYHMVVCWGEPSLLIVASAAKRNSLKNARASGVNSAIDVLLLVNLNEDSVNKCVCCGLAAPDTLNECSVNEQVCCG